ncbi:addiction module toxin RelE [Christensenellaceae bacterium OttesenSCG-928-M15]|nr:addiction module toxin RelE [Christensenellaceae bacterium OttesenSCG-928-M15]
MAAKRKKPLTQKERKLRASVKKELQAEGIIPPDKPRLNRKKFAKDVWEEYWKNVSYLDLPYLHRAIHCMVGENMREVTPEAVGVLKIMKLAVELKKFEKQLAVEGREEYKLEELYKAAIGPVINL